MGTMNFSIPDDVKDAFNEAFEGKNKSAIVTELLRRAIEDERRNRESLSFYERLRRIRQKSTMSVTDDEIRRIRDSMRD